MSIQRIIEIPVEEVRSEKYYETIERIGEHSDTCFLCGKRTNVKNVKFVHYLENGNIVSYSDDDIEGSQGFFPVGSECQKKLVIQFCF